MDYTFDILKLLAAAAAGALVGWDREIRDRPAGLRTHMLVCLTSTLLIIAAQMGVADNIMVGGTPVNADPARMAAGVVMGVGFLGAGTVFRRQDFVKGLTTAASIWAVAAIGIAIGFGAWIHALAVSGLAMLILLSGRLRKRG